MGYRLQVEPDIFALIHDYVLEQRGQGHCLPKRDVDRIICWIEAAGSLDQLMLTLGEVLPKLFSKEQYAQRTIPASLSSVHKKVINQLTEFRQRNLSTVSY